ncbi:ATP-binding protein [Sphingobacterium bovistauri]|uniref:histidine kinase n=1 Tax=Sphingobacterium bovistauri TaxID=2781959 RepID=A0ABS7Z0G1_9SPHI|nr:ATP-binding protein [Sphingobacterium bovistauri]MCA5003653.1 HAMP domain-containing histidine kinase [Sphingobacterium bovistauri]
MTTIFIAPYFCLGNDSSTDSLINVLKNDLKNKGSFDRSKEKRIVELNQKLASISPNEKNQQYTITNQLLDEYMPFQRDSAINIANKLIDISIKYNYNSNIARLKLAKILIISGALKEASDCLDKINIDNEIRENKLEYYHLKKWLNWAMAVSVGDKYYSKTYTEREAVYQDSAKMYANHENYDFQLLGIFSDAERTNKDKNYKNYLSIVHNYYKVQPHRAARLAYMLGDLYYDDEQKMLNFLIIASIFDVRNSTKETPAILKISNLLYQNGEIDNAYYLLQEGLDNATFFGSRLHKVEITNLLPKVTAQKIVQTERKIMIFIIILLFLTFIIIWFFFSRNKLKSLNQKISNKNIELQNILQELDKSQKENSWILKVLAHDLRGTIAGSIHLYEIFIHNQHLSPDEKKMLELLEETNQDALQTISDLLNVTTGNFDLKKHDTELDKLIVESASLLQYKANEKNQRLITKLISITVSINKEKIRRVIDNIISNAIKFSSPSSEIHIELQDKDNDSICIKVADNGIGIPEEFKSEIFEMKSKFRRQGTYGEESFGLGLYICKQIIDQHKGKIWIENNTNGGTIFFIELPKS